MKIDGKIIGYREAMVLPQRPQNCWWSDPVRLVLSLPTTTPFGTEVTVVEFLPRIVPVEDEEASKALERSFKKKQA